MIVACPHCSSQYDVDAALFGEAPRTVKCSDCGWEWLHLPDGVDFPPAPAAWNAEPAETSAAAHADGPDLSFGDAMAAAQLAIADAAKDASGDTALPAPTDAGAFAVAPAAGGSAAKGQPDGDAPAGPAADAEDDFEIELGSEETETVAAEPPPPAPPPRVPRWVVGISAAAATVVVLAAGLLLGRHAILEAVPGSAGMYRMLGVAVDAIGAGLEIGDVASSREWSEGEEALIVSGQITNTTPGPMPVPPLKVALYNEADQPLQSVTIPAAGKVLMAGETTPFRARIASPQETAQRIKITFDAASGG